MKDTVLEKLIKLWESQQGSYIPNAPIYKYFIDDAKNQLLAEKMQINDAYLKGVADGIKSVTSSKTILK
jgi:hypothetical protein